MLGLSANLRYFLCCNSVDMRNGFDGLAGIVGNHLKNDPISGLVDCIRQSYFMYKHFQNKYFRHCLFLVLFAKYSEMVHEHLLP